MVVVPGVVFDLSRNRIGYGAGYYDSFLKKTGGSCFKVGVAFDLQVVERIVPDAHDVALDMVITETRMI